MPKLGIILTTTRESRFADVPAQWVHDAASKRDDLHAEILDLRDDPLPFFGEVAASGSDAARSEAVVRWRKKLAEFEGFLFVTAEYNHSIPAVLKNALDHAYDEWNRKPAAYVGYGAVGAARAIQQLRQIHVPLDMAPLRGSVHIQGAAFSSSSQGTADLASIDYLNDGLDKALDELAWWTNALTTARQADAQETEQETAAA